MSNRTYSLMYSVPPTPDNDQWEDVSPIFRPISATNMQEAQEQRRVLAAELRLQPDDIVIEEQAHCNPPDEVTRTLENAKRHPHMRRFLLASLAHKLTRGCVGVVLAGMVLTGSAAHAADKSAPAPAAAAPCTVNVNMATPAELQYLYRTGPTLAGRIIEARTAAGGVLDLARLDAVKGVGEAWLAANGPHVRFGTGRDSGKGEQTTCTGKVKGPAREPKPESKSKSKPGPGETQSDTVRPNRG